MGDKQTDHGFAWRRGRGKVHERPADVVSVLGVGVAQRPSAGEAKVGQALNGFLRNAVCESSINVYRAEEIKEILRNGCVV